MGNQVEKLIRGKDKTSPHYKEVTAYADFDMILIACGTNDGVPSGDMEGSFTSENEMVAIEELDRRAFASAFRYSIEKLQQLYPAAKIYICTPIQGYIPTRSYAQSKAKGDYLKLLAGRMSLEVIDTFCCGICDIYMSHIMIPMETNQYIERSATYEETTQEFVDEIPIV